MGGATISIQQHQRIKQEMLKERQRQRLSHQRQCLSYQIRLREIERQKFQAEQKMAARELAMKHDYDSLQLKVKTLAKEQANFKNKYEQILKKQSKNRIQKRQLEEKINQLTDSNEDLWRQKQVLNQYGSQMQSKVDCYSKQLADKKRQLAETSEEAKIIEEEYNRFKSQLDTLIISLDKLEQEKLELQAECNRLKNLREQSLLRIKNPERRAQEINDMEDVQFEENLHGKFKGLFGKTVKVDWSSNIRENKS